MIEEPIETNKGARWDQETYLASIAISLKRIADHLDKPSYTQLGDALDLSISPNANRT